MKNKILTLMALLILVPAMAIAQTTTYSTITNAAVNATQTCFVVASTTNMSASGALTGPNSTPQEWDGWFDGEFVKINTVNTTSNQICVQRGKAPTRAGTHPTASVFFFGPAGASPFIVGAPLTTTPGNAIPGGFFGSCVSTGYLYLPLINVADGSISNCLTTAGGAVWVTYNFREWSSGHPVVNINNAAYTLTLADEFVMHTFNATGTARTDTLPSVTGVRGKTVTVKHNGPTGTLTVAAPNGQFVSTVGTASITLLNGGTAKLISIQATTGAWGWATVD